MDSRIELTDAPLVIDHLVVGFVTGIAGGEPRITLNLGYCKAAGVRVVVQGDPEVDHKRGGVVLDR